MNRDLHEFYRLGTLLFGGATFASYIVLFLFLLANQHNLMYYFAEMTTTILAFTLLIFTLLFAIALAITERRVRLNIEPKPKEPAKA